MMAGGGKTIKSALERLDDQIERVSARMADLSAAADKASREGLEKKARIGAEQVVPAMAALREVADEVEETVADEFWTLPKYHEMLFLV